LILGAELDYEGVENSKVKSSKPGGLSVPLESTERTENILAPNFGQPCSQQVTSLKFPTKQNPRKFSFPQSRAKI
jgi:hypothetical protein